MQHRDWRAGSLHKRHSKEADADRNQVHCVLCLRDLRKTGYDRETADRVVLKCYSDDAFIHSLLTPVQPCERYIKSTPRC